MKSAVGLSAVMPHLRVHASKGGRISLNAGRLECVVVLVSLILTACASSRVVDGIFVDEAKGFKISLLHDGWQRFELEGTDLAFRAEPDGQVAALLASCEDEQSIPLRILARRLFFGISTKRVLAQQSHSLHGTEVIHTLLAGRLQETEVIVSSYVARQGHCVYDLVYVAPPELFQAKLPEFEQFVNGWVLTEKGSELKVQGRGKAPQ